MENESKDIKNASAEANSESEKAADQILKDDLIAKELKVDRKNDFTHTHPTHAKHKNFGFDHEPGAF